MNELHQQILDQLHQTFVEKNSDYGSSAHLTYMKYGMTAYLIRIEDKFNRLQNLMNKDQLVKDESFRDTLLDLANYAIMAAMELEE